MVSINFFFVKTYILWVSVEYSSPRYRSLISVRGALALAAELFVLVLASLSSRASSAVCTSHWRDSSLSVFVSLPIPPMYKGEFWKHQKLLWSEKINFLTCYKITCFIYTHRKREREAYLYSECNKTYLVVIAFLT